MSYNKVGFCSLSYRLPTRIIPNLELEKKLNLRPGIIERLTGIQSRRYIDNGESLQSLAVDACQEAIEKSGLHPGEIDVLIFYSDTPPLLPTKEGPKRQYYDISAHIQYLLKKKGLELNCECFCIAGSCVSFLVALQMASAFIQSGMKRNILLIGAAWNSYFLNGNDKNSTMTFADGAAACIVTKTQDEGFLGIFVRTDGQGFDAGYFPDYNSLYIDRKQVAEFAPKAFHAGISGLLKKTGVTTGDVDLFIPHQAGIRIIRNGLGLSGIPEEKVYLCLQETGNIGAPAVQLALAKAAAEGRIRQGDMVVLAAFGTGWNYGAAAFRYHCMFKSERRP